MEYSYPFLFINAVLFAYQLIMTFRNIIHRDWEKVSATGAATFILMWALVARLYGFQMWHVMGHETP